MKLKKKVKYTLAVIAFILFTIMEWNIAQEIKADEQKYQAYVRSITE